MTVRQLVQQLQDTAPGEAEVLVRAAGAVGEARVRYAHVETREGYVEPVVIMYLKA